jgi:hypothetical protein
LIGVCRDTLDELERTYKAPEKVETITAKADIFNAAHYSTGQLFPLRYTFFGDTAMKPKFLFSF